MLGFGFGAYGEGVQEVEREGEAQGVVLAVAKLALAKNLHANDAFSCRAHLAHDADHSSRIGVHEGPNGIDPNKMDFDPRRFCGGAERFNAVAGATMGPDDALLLGFGEDVHDAFVAVGPIAIGKAVHQANINIVGTKFAAKAVNIGASGGWVARPGLGKYGNFVARHVFERFGDMRVASIGIGGVEKAKAMIVAVEKQVGEAFDA